MRKLKIGGGGFLLPLEEDQFQRMLERHMRAFAFSSEEIECVDPTIIELKVIFTLPHLPCVRNSTKTEKELVLKEGLVLLLGTILRQRRISTMRGVELWEKGQVSEMEREREKERMMIRKIYVLCEGNIQ